MPCDLHTHSFHSDGSLSPTQLIESAKEKNLIIALTDHNTVSGVDIFMKEAERLGVTAVGGTELSTAYNGREIHLIGLFISPDKYSDVESLCKEHLEFKEQSNIQLIDRLAKLGYKLDYEELKTRNVKGHINRAHIASAMKDKGYVNSVTEAFFRFLDEELGIYVPPKRLALIDGIRFLRDIKAVPVFAHPLKDLADYELREMLPELKKEGLIAMETMHSSYNSEQIKISKEIVFELGLLESGGSDFHGTVKPGIELGVGKGNLNVSDDVFYKLRDAHDRL